MSRKHIRFGSASALLVALLLTTVEGAEPAKTSQDAKAKLEALKKRLPKLIDRGRRAANWSGIEPERVKVRVARLTAPTQAKIILTITGPKDSEWDDSVLILHLRYYEGAWTTKKCEGTMPRLDLYKAYLELAIDEDGGK